MKQLIFAVLLFSSFAVAQGVRYDIPPILSPRGTPLANVQVSLCSGTATITGSTCNTPTQSFTDITLVTQCSVGSPVTLANSSNCQGTSDASGNAGFWLSPGAYIYCLNGPQISGQCYNLTAPVGVTSGGAVGSLNLTSENGIQVVGNGTNTNIAAAVTNASSTGAVLIPPGYAGTDNAFTGNAPMIDYRQNTQGAVGFWHGARALFPVTNFPGGNDWMTSVFGPADIHLANGPIDCTSSTSIAGAGTTTITVGTCADSSGNGGPSGTTAKLSHATGVQIILEPGTANEEFVSNANWSILSGTTLSVTTSLAHTQPFTVRQQGILFLDGRTLRFNPPPGSLSYSLIDSNNNLIAKVPANTGGTFPNSAWQWTALQTGATGGTSNETHRNATSSSVWLIQNSAATASILQVTESGGAGILTMGNPTNNSFQLQATADVPRLSFGGTSNGAILYSSRGGTGTSGTFFFRNNITDDSPKVQIGTGATANVVIFGSSSGSSTIQAPSTGGVTSTLPTTAGTLGVIVASGTSTLTANATLTAVTSQTAITTAATGTATTDAIEWSYASAPGAGDSLCIVSAYVTAGNVNFVRSNPTAASQNVSAIVINWRVVR